MLMSFKNANNILGKAWLIFSVVSAASLFGFIVTMFMLRVPFSKHVAIALALVTILGMLYGAYFTFYAKFDSSSSLCMLLFVMLTVFVVIGSSGCALAVELANHVELRWLAFFTNAVCIVLSLLVGAVREAKALGGWRGNPTSVWRERIERYIDYSKRQVSPSLTGDKANYKEIKHPYIIIGVGVANIPLLFELYGGGRANAIFLAAPLSMLAFSYLNLKTLGPAFARLLLLRRIEKEVGYRFQNADYEQIQELRRGFFLSRWLMKDYRPPKVESYSITASDNSNLSGETKQKRKKKNRR
jgi:hypothetical protein